MKAFKVERSGISTARTTLDMGDMMKSLTVTVTVKRARIFRFRLWLGLLFVKLGGRIIGFGGIDVRNDEA